MREVLKKDNVFGVKKKKRCGGGAYEKSRSGRLKEVSKEPLSV